MFRCAESDRNNRTLPKKMITKTSSNLLLVVINQQLCNVPLASSQEASSLLPNNCLAAPCRYRGECRDRMGVCGDTVTHCNGESLWVSGCGGGLDLEKPMGVQEFVPSPTPPTNQPPGTMAPPTENPTTAWQAWIGKGKDNQPSNEENAEDMDHSIDATAGNAGAKTKSAPTNGTELVGFNANAWGYRGSENSEDEGLLDKGLGMIGFGSDDENASAVINGRICIYLLSAASAMVNLL